MREELIEKENVNNLYELMCDMNNKFNSLKGYEAACGNPKKGKMIINFNGKLFFVDVKPIQTIGELTLENAIEEFDYMFRN